VVSPFLHDTNNQPAYLVPSNRYRDFHEYRIYEQVQVRSLVANVAIDKRIINPYGGYLSGIVEYQPSVSAIRFFERYPNFCFCIRFAKPENLPKLPPRRLPTWITTNRDYQYNNVAKLIRDVVPEFIGKSIKLAPRRIEEAEYYLFSDDYASGLP